MEETKTPGQSVVVDLTKPAAVGKTEEGVDISKLSPEQIEQLAEFVAQIKNKMKRSKHAGQKRQSRATLQKKKDKKKKLRKIAYASKRLNRQRAA